MFAAYLVSQDQKSPRHLYRPRFQRNVECAEKRTLRNSDRYVGNIHLGFCAVGVCLVIMSSDGSCSSDDFRSSTFSLARRSESTRLSFSTSLPSLTHPQNAEIPKHNLSHRQLIQSESWSPFLNTQELLKRSELTRLSATLWEQNSEWRLPVSFTTTYLNAPADRDKTSLVHCQRIHLQQKHIPALEA